MATVINNPAERAERTSERYVESDSGAGWAVAIIVLLAVVVVGAFLWYRYSAAPAGTVPGTNVQVTLPSAGNTQSTSRSQTTPATPGTGATTPAPGATTPSPSGP